MRPSVYYSGLDGRLEMDIARRWVTIGLMVFPLIAGGRPGVSLPVVRLRIATVGDELAFRPDHLSCRAGATVLLSFHHAGEISSDPHDWVLLKPGTEFAFLADADKGSDDTVVGSCTG
jgi:hypothetical protein